MIQASKTEATPKTEVEFLGLVIDTVAQTFKAPEAKREKVARQITELLACGERKIPVKRLAKVAGFLNSLRLAYPWCGPLCRSLFHLMSTRSSWTDTIYLDGHMHEDLSSVLTFLSTWHGRASYASTSSSIVVGSDASKLSYGIWIQTSRVASSELSDRATGLASALHDKLYVRGEWDEEERQLHINELELLAASRAIDFAFACCDEGLFSQLDGITALNTVSEVAALVDSRAAAAYVRRAGGSNERMVALARSIWKKCLARGLVARSVWVKGADHTLADASSRVSTDREYELRREVFDFVHAWCGVTLTVDRFASARTAKLPRYNSRLVEYGSLAVDALSQLWRGETNYVYAPPALLDAVVRKIRLEEATAVVIVPAWSDQTWWRALVAAADAQLDLGPAAEALIVWHDGRPHKEQTLTTCLPLC